MTDKPIRSIAKAVSWRAVGTIDTMILSFLITGKLRFALTIGFAELVTKTGLFFFHERAWDKIGFGKAKEPEFYL